MQYKISKNDTDNMNNPQYRKIKQKHKVETRDETIGLWALGLEAGPSYSAFVGQQKLSVLCQMEVKKLPYC